MSIKTMPPKELIPNELNPRFIKSDKFKTLVKSIKEFSVMTELRPVVLDLDKIIIGGNMRYRAMCEAKWKEIPVMILTQALVDKNNEKRVAQGLKPKTYKEVREEFIIKDNVEAGSWDVDVLANNFDLTTLEDWGLPQWDAPPTIDYDILGQGENEEAIDELADGVKRAIQIEFTLDNYEICYELVKHFRDQGEDVGLMLIEKLQDEKTR